MILHVENPKDNKKINIQTSVAFLYNNNEKSKEEIKKISFFNGNKKNKTLRNELSEKG